MRGGRCLQCCVRLGEGGEKWKMEGGEGNRGEEEEQEQQEGERRVN